MGLRCAVDVIARFNNAVRRFDYLGKVIEEEIDSAELRGRCMGYTELEDQIIEVLGEEADSDLPLPKIVEKIKKERDDLRSKIKEMRWAQLLEGNVSNDALHTTDEGSYARSDFRRRNVRSDGS